MPAVKPADTFHFWLVFKNGRDQSVIIQPADDIITARVKVLLAGAEGKFQEGHMLDQKTAKKVPKKMIGRVLSRKEAAEILKKLGA